MDNSFAFLIAAAVLLFFMRRYLKDMKKKDAQRATLPRRGSCAPMALKLSIRISTRHTASAARLARRSAPRAMSWRCSAARPSS